GRERRSREPIPATSAALAVRSAEPEQRGEPEQQGPPASVEPVQPPAVRELPMHDPISTSDPGQRPVARLSRAVPLHWKRLRLVPEKNLRRPMQLPDWPGPPRRRGGLDYLRPLAPQHFAPARSWVPNRWR